MAEQEMARIAQTCDAIKPLQDQFTQLTGGFNVHITALMKALEPAEEVRLRIVQLAEAFEPLATLHERLAELQGGSVTWASQSKVAKVFVIGANFCVGIGNSSMYFAAKNSYQRSTPR